MAGSRRRSADACSRRVLMASLCGRSRDLPGLRGTSWRASKRMRGEVKAFVGRAATEGAWRSLPRWRIARIAWADAVGGLSCAPDVLANIAACFLPLPPAYFANLFDGGIIEAVTGLSLRGCGGWTFVTHRWNSS
jgi:hypothetical protein